LWRAVDNDLLDALWEHTVLTARLAELGVRLVAEVDSRGIASKAGGSSTRALLVEVLHLAPVVARRMLALAQSLPTGPITLDDQGDTDADPSDNLDTDDIAGEGDTADATGADDTAGDGDTAGEGDTADTANADDTADATGADDTADATGADDASASPAADTDEEATLYAATRAALAMGEIGLEQAGEIRATIEGFPRTIDLAQRLAGEAILLQMAREAPLPELRKIAQVLRQRLDPDRKPRDEAEARARTELFLLDNGDGTGTVRGTFDDETIALWRALLDPLAKPCPSADGTPDMRSPARRRGDAMRELLTRWADHGTDVPRRHGHRPHLIVLTTEATLRGEPDAPLGETPYGQPLSPEAVARIGCDARITPVLCDQAGVPLKLGRTQRLVSPGLWLALLTRDQGCTFEGCTRPADWCHAHHLRWWINGGTTDLDEMALLCEHHHARVHAEHWEGRIGCDGHPEYIPPGWVDARHTPRRNTYWRGMRELNLGYDGLRVNEPGCESPPGRPS